MPVGQRYGPLTAGGILKIDIFDWYCVFTTLWTRVICSWSLMNANMNIDVAEDLTNSNFISIPFFFDSFTFLSFQIQL